MSELQVSESELASLKTIFKWSHGAASKGGMIAGIQAASYVESGQLLLCWK